MYMCCISSPNPGCFQYVEFNCRVIYRELFVRAHFVDANGQLLVSWLGHLLRVSSRICSSRHSTFM